MTRLPSPFETVRKIYADRNLLVSDDQARMGLLPSECVIALQFDRAQIRTRLEELRESVCEGFPHTFCGTKYKFPCHSCKEILDLEKDLGGSN